MVDWSLAFACISPLCFLWIRRVFTLVTIWTFGHCLFQKELWGTFGQPVITNDISIVHFTLTIGALYFTPPRDPSNTSRPFISLMLYWVSISADTGADEENEKFEQVDEYQLFVRVCLILILSSPSLLFIDCPLMFDCIVSQIEKMHKKLRDSPKSVSNTPCALFIE